MEDLPPGFRFFPTEEELVLFYLHNKLEGKRHDLDRVIPVVDMYKHDPWHLPQISGELCRGDPEQWFFFTPRQEREARGRRPTRTTTSGYWKATGSPGYVYSSSNRVIGMKRTMVFYTGRVPNGRKTEWTMNEYRAIQEATSSSSTATPKYLRREFSLCRVYMRSSGCLRAFDRRPSGIVTSNEIPMEQVHADVVGPSHRNPSPMVEKASSSDSSSSGNHVSPTSDEITNWDDLQTLLELEHELNWD